ncbi:hypothetical protein MCOR27_000945 [Pyricularia oryzae]|nr:hypothetical protein MCOR01_008029 [Pyricularia oryzae]KAI6252944.1 hypothetical protein MCOR19_010476 [Pyricularia oryzae]KAI6284041.1 hypothetical protein MCOR26_002169 [Pyricularia oryzae]KAI6288628.1 hypothetical protein MCOR27_000945 [Pyricularia oryzae]KAI6313443.1 hypothetical protein MCOR29_007699 [Pyricularia oryzae]
MYKYALPSSCRRTMIKLSRDSTAIHRENYTQISTAPKLTKSLKMASLYQQTIPVFIKYLKAMDGLLVKGEKYADENEVAHDDMINYRIVPDMRGLAYQVQSCSNTARFVLSRVGRIPHVPMEDNETTFAELRDRVARTIKVLEEFDAKALDRPADEEVVMETKVGRFGFTCQSYISEFAIPNFHFHLSTAYCILRGQKVPLEALDYLKDVFHTVPAAEEGK